MIDYNTYQIMVKAYAATLEHDESTKDRTWALGPSMEYLQIQTLEVPPPDVLCRLNGGELDWPDRDVDVGRRYDIQGMGL